MKRFTVWIHENPRIIMADDVDFDYENDTVRLVCDDENYVFGRLVAWFRWSGICGIDIDPAYQKVEK